VRGTTARAKLRERRSCSTDHAITAEGYIMYRGTREGTVVIRATGSSIQQQLSVYVASSSPE